jgi:uncharacterized membrane protein
MSEFAPGITANVAQPTPGPVVRRALPYLVVGVAALALLSWLLNTPEGLLGKADAVGYAICHRIDGRSFHLGDRQFPLCARCTGIYLGVLVGFVGQLLLGRGRAGGLPGRPILFTLFGFIGLMGVDGLNSYSHFFAFLPHLYEPTPWLRLITGSFNGLALASIIYPILNQTLWANWEDRPVLRRFRDMAWLVAGVAVVILLVLIDNPLLLYPLALLSAVGVVAILVVLNTTILLVVARRENRALGWRGAALPLVAGFALAILEIGAVDAVRYAIFQTWGGLPLPG